MNPNKPATIVDILRNNRDKLLKYLEDFHTDRGERAGRVCVFVCVCVYLCICVDRSRGAPGGSRWGGGSLEGVR